MQAAAPDQADQGETLASAGSFAHIAGAMWQEPYLETCCRAALHRLALSGSIGRPPGLKDGPCLQRLAGMGLVTLRADGCFAMSEAGRARHGSEVARDGRAPP